MNIKLLQSHANSQDGDLASKVSDSIPADTAVSRGVTGTGADDELRWLLGNELVESNLVISENVHGGTLENQILIDVPGERVIVINHNQVRRRRNRW